MNPFFRSAFICFLLFLALGLMDSREESKNSDSHLASIESIRVGDCILPVSSDPEFKTRGILHHTQLRGIDETGRMEPEGAYSRTVQLAVKLWQIEFLDFKPELFWSTGHYLPRIQELPEPSVRI